jgi:lipopolysaccharide export system protein LptA
MKQSKFLKILLLSALSFLGSTSLLADVDTPNASQTVISSDRLEMNNNGQTASFNFTGNIKLTGTNLIVTCDVLEVQTERNEDPETSTEKLGSIRSIIAIGNVSISQRGRKATAGRAEVYPNEDKIILTENPIAIDDQGTVMTGGKMTLFRGVGKILIESDTSNRVKVSSSALPDLGFSEKEGKQATPPEEVPTDSELENPPSEENQDVTVSPSSEEKESSIPTPSQTTP